MNSVPTPSRPPARTHRGWHAALCVAAAAVLTSALTLGFGHAAQAADTLLSQDRIVTVSSTQVSGTPGNAAVDSDATTRWASAATDNQWIMIDLSATSTISRIHLQWEAAYAKAFQLQTSPDAVTWTTIYSTTNGTGGTQDLTVSGTGRYVRMNGVQRGTGYGYSLYEFQVYGSQPGAPAPGGPGYILASPQVTNVTASHATPPNAYFHEFQANCTANHTLPDDPIVFPGQAGASHMHTFMGNTATTANSTTVASFEAGGTSCVAPGDKSGYWMPTMYNGNTAILPTGPQVIYYKTNLIDYTSVRPFPKGLRYLVGSPGNNATQFIQESYEGWECGDSYYNADFPASCPAGTQLNVRFQAPSCWDGRYLDTPDHKSHMAYPVDGRCTIGHPVALPMIEFKMALPVSGDLSQVRLSSGRGYSFHYDFFNDWDDPTQAAMVAHCIDGGLQCDARGYDQNHPEKGAVLNSQYLLP